MSIVLNPDDDDAPAAGVVDVAPWAVSASASLVGCGRDGSTLPSATTTASVAARIASFSPMMCRVRIGRIPTGGFRSSITVVRKLSRRDCSL